MDIDGCLCNSSEGVKNYLLKENKNYKKFREDFLKYPAYLWAKRLTNQMFDLCDVIILTAREDTNNTRKDTEEWLRNKGIMYTKLIMKKRNCFEEGRVIKKRELKEIKKEYRVLFAVDDNPEINKMYQEEGVLCLQPNNHLYSS